MTHSYECFPNPSVRGRSALALATGIALAAFVACSESDPGREPPPSEQQQPQRPPPDPAVIGDVEQGAGTLPDGFPEDLPLYPGSSPTRWMTATGPGALVVFEADVGPARVYEHFEKELPAAGWVIDATTAGPANWTVMASKDDRNARISIATSEMGAQYGIAVATAD